MSLTNLILFCVGPYLFSIGELISPNVLSPDGSSER